MFWTFFDMRQKLFFKKKCRCSLYSSRWSHRWKICCSASSTLFTITARFISKIRGEIFHIAGVAPYIILYVAQLLQFLLSHFIVGRKIHLPQTAYSSIQTAFKIAFDKALFL